MSTGATGTTLVFDCIPDLGSFLPPFIQPLVPQLKCCKPNGNQLYSLGYAGIQVAEFLTEDLFAGLTGFTGFTGFTGATGATGGQLINDAISRAEFWFGRLAVFMILPWLLIFIGLFIYLGITGAMSGFAVIIFIIMTLVVAGFALFLILWDARYTVLNINNDVKAGINIIGNDVRQRINTVSERWDEWKVPLSLYLGNSYRLEKSCNNTGTVNVEAQACCNFSGTCASCDLAFSASPPVVGPGTTGQLTFTVGLPVGSTGGYIVIPPELNNNVSTTVQLDSTGKVIFDYTAVNRETIGLVDAVIFTTTGGFFAPKQFVLSTTVFIRNATMEDLQEETEVNMEELDNETLASMEQLRKALLETQLLQEKLQQRLQGVNNKQPVPLLQNSQSMRRIGGCRGCGDK